MLVGALVQHKSQDLYCLVLSRIKSTLLRQKAVSDDFFENELSYGNITGNPQALIFLDGWALSHSSIQLQRFEKGSMFKFTLNC